MNLEDTKPDFEQTIAHLKKELSQITTGRADPSLLEDVSILAYESTMKLQELASITVPEPRHLLIEPWDKSVVKDIAAGLQSANLDGQIQVSGDSIRFVVPQMTEENRNSYVRTLKDKLERARIAIRGTRDKAKDSIQREEKQKEISEDEKFAALKELDTLTNDYNETIKQIGEHKEKELLTI